MGLGWGVVAATGAPSQNKSGGVGVSVGRGVAVSHCSVGLEAIAAVAVAVAGVGALAGRPGVVAGVEVAEGDGGLGMAVAGAGVAYWARAPGLAGPSTQAAVASPSATCMASPAARAAARQDPIRKGQSTPRRGAGE